MIKQLAEKHGEVYIVITNLSKLSAVNPLKSTESKALLLKGLREMGLTPPRVNIIRMRRPKKVVRMDPNLWIYNAMARKLKKPFVFYTGNKGVMESLRGKPDILPLRVLSPQEIQSARIKNKKLNATEIRRLIRARLRWEHLLPKQVAHLLKKKGLIDRIINTRGLRGVHKHQK
ncbi:MAG: hypothetical protein PHD05_01385 [Sphaerochaetaceae bacterium]|nr:hypothetical protein [Sphaerochaetaceae bacterium]